MGLHHHDVMGYITMILMGLHHHDVMGLHPHDVMAQGVFSLLQLHATITEHVPPENVGLAPGSPLLSSLKQCVVELARNSNVLETVQISAQNVLKHGWIILLPTVSERAGALSQLLPTGDGTYSY